MMVVNLNKEEFEMIQACLLQSVELDFLPKDIEVIRSLLADQFKGIGIEQTTAQFGTNNKRGPRQVNYQDVEVPKGKD